MPPGQGPVLRCRHCEAGIRRAWRRPEWMHVDGWLWYCVIDGVHQYQLHAEPRTRGE
jgi:hypothetical protein